MNPLNQINLLAVQGHLCDATVLQLQRAVEAEMRAREPQRPMGAESARVVLLVLAGVVLLLVVGVVAAGKYGASQNTHSEGPVE